jgi:hypothetical protein
MEALKLALKNHPYLRYMETTWRDDTLLQTYLNMAKSDVARCIKKLEIMVQSRAELFDETMRDRNPALQSDLLQSLMVVPCPPNTVIVRVGRLNPDKYTIMDAICVGMIYYDFLVREEPSFFDTTRTNGRSPTIIIDMANLKFGHFIRAMQVLCKLRKLIRLNQDGSLGARPNVHIINASFSMEFFLCILRKLAHRVNFTVSNTNEDDDQVDSPDEGQYYVDSLLEPQWQAFFEQTIREQKEMMDQIKENC